MKMNVNLEQCLELIGPQIAENGRVADESDQFSKDNYRLLAEQRVFSGMVPQEFGGSGVSYAEMAALLRNLAAYHPSTALSCSMHQHIVAANLYKHLHGQPGQAVLEKVGGSEAVLVSTHEGGQAVEQRTRGIRGAGDLVGPLDLSQNLLLTEHHGVEPAGHAEQMVNRLVDARHSTTPANASAGALSPLRSVRWTLAPAVGRAAR